MLTTTLAQALLVPAALFSPLLLAGGSPQQAKAAPPTCVTLKEMRTTIGADPKDIRQLAEDNESYRTVLRTLDAETPQKSVKVETFHLMVTEVTNEQYAAFVAASGHRPPFEWGDEALTAAGQALLKADAEKRAKLTAEGKPAGPRFIFDPEQKRMWWDNHWQEAKWALPKGSELRPVVYVDYADALAYAAWAGLRLPTELEFQRAVRGNGKANYPWGDEWEDGKYAATAEIKRLESAKPVGSFPEGASKEGVFDLAGNVWEWTTSGYLALDGFRKNKYVFGKGSKRDTIEPEPDWNGNRRVVVGGCYQGSKLAARATTRRGTDRTQMTNAMGFRCAASEKQGIDIANAVFNSEIKGSIARPGDVTYNTNECAAIDRWDALPSTAEAPSKDYALPSGYQVISNYDHIVFVPIEKCLRSSSLDLGQTSRVSPEHLGFLTTNQSLLVPELPAGSYLIAYRKAGKPRQAEADPDAEEEAPKESEEPAQEVSEDPLLKGVDLKRDNFIFYDALTGEVAATLEATSCGIDKVRAASSFSWDEKKVWVGTGKDQVQEVQKWLVLDGTSQGTITNRGLSFQIKFLPNKRATQLIWR